MQYPNIQKQSLIISTCWHGDKKNVGLDLLDAVKVRERLDTFLLLLLKLTGKPWEGFPIATGFHVNDYPFFISLTFPPTFTSCCVSHTGLVKNHQTLKKVNMIPICNGKNNNRKKKKSKKTKKRKRRKKLKKTEGHGNVPLEMEMFEFAFFLSLAITWYSITVPCTVRYDKTVLKTYLVSIRKMSSR